jgi:hypothetical protein
MTSIHGPAGLARHESAARPADTAAMDDIQALLASPRRPPGEEALEEIAEIVARTGRALVAPRDFTVECDDDERGLPYVAVRSDGITVRVGQDPVSGSVRIAICTVTLRARLHDLCPGRIVARLGTRGSTTVIVGL